MAHIEGNVAGLPREAARLKLERINVKRADAPSEVVMAIPNAEAPRRHSNGRQSQLRPRHAKPLERRSASTSSEEGRLVRPD